MHLEAAEAASNVIGLDVASLIGGVILAVIVGTLIPFATEQWSLWSKRRGQIIAARREALDEYEQTTARVKMKLLAMHSSAGVRYENAVANDGERQAAVAKFVAQFSLKDKPIYDLWALERPPRGYRLVLSSWANGENIRARRAARRLLVEIREREQGPERQPEADTAEKPSDQADQ